MKENITMFKYTQMVIFFALSTAFYAVILWIFAVMPLWIVPGVTALRPGNAIPPVTSLLWGPAATWGTALGNLIGFDVLGGALGWGSVGGFIGNWVYGLLPYYTWNKVFTEEPDCKTTSSLIKFELTTFLASSACAMVISTWVEAFNLFPFSILSLIITFNNFIAGAILGPILMVIFYDRVKRLGWLWTDVMQEYSMTARVKSKKAFTGYILVWIGFVVGNFVTILLGFGLTGAFWSPVEGIIGVDWSQFGKAFGGLPVVATALVFIAIGVVGLAMMEFAAQWEVPPEAKEEEEEE
ncbi:MAG: hypothetical protein DRO67_10055 [Candidatus Asgardarchaeum californiense]|nr:MAG: hypothetical protein DRO67_10055 [Candidatus Asgardarchaeum californiense]